MKEIKFFELIKSAFFMTIKSRLMWFFGFLAFIGSFTTTFNNSDYSAEQKNQFLQTISSFNQAHPFLSAVFAFTVILLLAFLYILKLVATAALIKISNNFAVYKQSGINSVFNESKEYIWKLFSMEIMIGLTLFIIAILILAPISYLFLTNSKILASVFLIFGLFIITILLILAYYLIRFGQIYLVLGNTKIKFAIESAYELLEKNIKTNTLFGLTCFGLNIAFLLFLIIATILLGIILFLLGLVLNFALPQTFLNGSLILAIAIIIFFIVALFSWFTAFMQSLWVLFFQQINFEKKEEKKEIEKELEADTIIPDPEAV